MMKLRRIVSLCLAALLCVSLWGCTSAPVTSQKPTDDQPLETTGEKLKVYKAKLIDFSIDEVLEIFPHQGEIAYSREEEDFLAYSYVGKGVHPADGGLLRIQPRDFTYYTKEWHDYPLQWFLSISYAPDVFPDGVEKACPKRDLWFMTWDEAHALVRDYLDRMGVEYYSEEWCCYPVTGEYLTELVNERYPQEQYEQAVANGAVPSKRLLTEEDDVYMFRIPLAVEGNPLLLGDDIEFQGHYAEAMVGSTGLWYLMVSNPMEVTDVVSSEATISEETALGLVEDYFSRMPNVNMEDLTLTCRGARYATVWTERDDEGEYKITPAWEIEAVRVIGEITVKTVFTVDAITGKVTAVTQ